MHSKRLLVPVNLTDDSLDTILFARKMADEFSVSLTLLNVVRLNIAFENGVYGELCAESEEALNRIQTRFFSTAQDVSVRVRVGKPHEEIVAEAKTGRAELIVLSSPKPSLWKRLFVDGTVKGVVRAAPCPTLVLPLAWKATPEKYVDAAQPAREVVAHEFAMAPGC